jgi:hypothetical protein
MREKLAAFSSGHSFTPLEKMYISLQYLHRRALAHDLREKKKNRGVEKSK